MIDLDKLSALEKAAKPAPWYAWLDPNNNNIEDKCITTIPEEQYIREYNALCGKRWLESNEEVIGCSEWMRADDADFLLIVEMRNQLPDLIVRIAELEAERALFVEPGSTLEAAIGRIREMEKRNADLEARVAALKEIAGEERAAVLACFEDAYGVTEEHRLEARRQLAKEHLEAFR
jgi:hypothetical protein